MRKTDRSAQMKKLFSFHKTRTQSHKDKRDEKTTKKNSTHHVGTSVPQKSADSTPQSSTTPKTLVDNKDSVSSEVGSASPQTNQGPTDSVLHDDADTTDQLSLWPLSAVSPEKKIPQKVSSTDDIAEITTDPLHIVSVEKSPEKTSGSAPKHLSTNKSTQTGRSARELLSAAAAKKVPPKKINEQSVSKTDKHRQKKAAVQKKTIILSPQARKTGIVVVSLISVLALAITGTMWWWSGTHSSPNTAQKISSQRQWNDNLAPQIVPMANETSIPTQLGIEKAIGTLVRDPRLAPIAVIVNDARTGKKIWGYHENDQMTPASVLKLLTAAAALIGMPRDHRVATKIVKGNNEHSIVLVGGGDATLTSVTSSTGLYPGAASIKDLANRIRPYLSTHNINSIVVDQSLYQGPTFPSYWIRADIAGGAITPIVPTMVDAGRVTPGYPDSPRVAHPGIAAGRALARALELPETTAVTIGKASPHAATLGTVYSAPLITRLRQMLHMSDNVLASQIAMELAHYQHRPMTLDSSIHTVQDILNAHGISTIGSHVVDANGLSNFDKISVTVEANTLVAASKKHPHHPALRALWDLLPVAGVSGTLSHRFTGPNAISAGFIHAKTGTLTGVSSLAGLVVDKDKRPLDFVIISNALKTDTVQVRTQLDTIATRLYSCGCTK